MSGRPGNLNPRRPLLALSVRSIEKRRVLGEVGEWLMMELENDVRIVCRLRVVLERSVPTARVPFPADPGIIHAIANCNDVTRLRWIGVVNQQPQSWVRRAR